MKNQLAGLAQDYLRFFVYEALDGWKSELSSEECDEMTDQLYADVMGWTR